MESQKQQGGRGLPGAGGHRVGVVNQVDLHCCVSFRSTANPYICVGVSLKRDTVSVTGHNNVLFGWGFFAFLFLFSFSGHTTGHVESQFLDQGWSPQSLQWKCGVSTTGLSRELRKKVCARH